MQVTLKLGKEKAIRNRHHWIFSGAIQTFPEKFVEGDFLPVHSAEGEFLGTAYFNRKSKIIGRMVAFDTTPPLQAIEQSLDSALAYRNQLFQNHATTVYRLVNGDGDFLPGVIVDKYQDVVVIQLATLGMDRLRDWLVELLRHKLKPGSIYEKSLLPSRKEEGLSPIAGTRYGPEPREVEVQENGLKFIVSPVEGQKTGFFIDQREMRQWVKALAKDKRVLNCFAYTGAFSVYAAAGGATSIDSIDISKPAMQLAERQMALNHFNGIQQRWFTGDVFQFLRTHDLDYQLIILDPPAFAKRQSEVVAACRGYKDINRLALSKMPPHSLLLTCSCSYHVDAALFQKVIFQAAVEAKRAVRIIGTHRMAPDHPINVCHPEGSYLKSLLLYVD